MKLGKKTILLGMVLLLCSFIVSTATTQAKHVNPPIYFEYVWDYTEPALKFWFDKDGVYHAIKTPHIGHVTSGDIDGDIYYNGNVVLDFATLDGKGGGIFEFTGTYGLDAAGFRGKLLFYIEAGVIYGTLNCPGTGAFAGMLLKGTVFAYLDLGQNPPPAVAELVIWNK